MKKSAIAFLFIAAGILCVFFVLHTVFGSDTPSFSTADLRVVRAEIPAAENAFTYLVQVTNFYSGTNEMGDLAGIVETNDWDEPYIAGIIASNSETLLLIDKGLSCDKLVVPAIEGWDTPVQYITHMRNMGRLMVFRSGWLYRCGNERDAYEQALQAVKLGWMIQGCGGGMLHYLVGVAVKGLGMSQLETMLKDCDLGAEDLRRYAETLSGYELVDESFADVFRVEYLYGETAIDSLLAGKDGYSGFFGSEKLEAIARHSSYIFQPNRTKRSHAERSRRMIRSIPGSFSEIEWPDESECMHGTGSLAEMLKPNMAGRMILRMLEPSYRSMFDRKCRDVLQLKATRLVMLLKAYRIEKGRLPEALEELVPAYIDSVPTDPYDGAPLRYSAERGIIYSVGSDGFDSHGATELLNSASTYQTNRWHRHDFVFDIAP